MKKRKLIETQMPISKICEEAEKEKTFRSGAPSNIHIWWNRTPSSISRTVLFASLVDDPSIHENQFATQNSQQKERNRLLEIVEKLSEIDCISDKKLISEAIHETQKYIENDTPKVFDPFVGGGSIPVEAHRLKLESISADVNPVSSTITTMLSDIPFRFTNKEHIHPHRKMDKSCFSGFAEDLRYYGEKLEQSAFDKIGHLFPLVNNPNTNSLIEVAFWIWVRTVTCPNPACTCPIPLSFCYDLAKKDKNEAWVEPIVENGNIHFKLHNGKNSLIKNKAKVAQTAVFKCPACGEITSDSYVKECGKNKKINYKLLAIAAEENKKRVFIEATSEQESIANVIKPNDLPAGELPIFPGKFTPPSFGYNNYSDLFTNRQLVYITTMFDLCRKLQKNIEKDAIKKGYANDRVSFVNGGSGALAYAEAIRTSLVLTISKMLDRYSNLCSWNSSNGGAIRNVFSRPAMPMIWDFAEGNPFSSVGGSFSSTLYRVCESLASLPSNIKGITYCGDASEPNSVCDALVFTDLPYYDRTPYQELSDYFYVWMKYGLNDVFPQIFKDEVTLKEKDITAFPYRYSGNRDAANAFYVDKMRSAISRLYESASTEYPSVIGYMYKKSVSDNRKLTEWEQFVTAIIDAGFSITASWPLYGRKCTPNLSDTENNMTPIIVVVRKEEEKEPIITRRLFVSNVKREIPRIIEKLQKTVSSADLRTCVIGQALNIYSRHTRIIDADGEEMKPYTASRIIEQEIDTQITNYYNDIK